MQKLVPLVKAFTLPWRFAVQLSSLLKPRYDVSSFAAGSSESMAHP